MTTSNDHEEVNFGCDRSVAFLGIFFTIGMLAIASIQSLSLFEIVKHREATSVLFEGSERFAAEQPEHARSKLVFQCELSPSSSESSIALEVWRAMWLRM